MSVSAEWFLRIKELLENQNYEIAKKIIKEKIREGDNTDTLRFLLAKIYHASEEDKASLIYINSAIKICPNNKEYKAWKLLVSSILRKSDCDELYKQISDMDGQLVDIAIGEYYLYKYNYQKAYQFAQKAYEKDGTDVDAIILLLKVMDGLDLQSSDYLKIMNELEKIFDERVIKLELKILYKREQYDICEKMAKKLMRKYPNTEVSIYASNIMRKIRDNKKIEWPQVSGVKRLVSEKKYTPVDCEEKILDEGLAKLNELIGLNDVKTQINMICKTVLFEKQRAKLLREYLSNNGEFRGQASYHFVFSGNPGTGKTTVARLFGEIFHGLGILEKGQLIETDRSGLVGEYIGATAQKTQAVINKAMGGVLFIDEAYSLYKPDGTTQDFGMEAIDTLVKAIEDNREKFIVILAGYKNEMKELMKANPGLESRFTKFIEFTDYSEEELLQIAVKIAKENAYTISEDGKKAFITLVRRQMVDERFGNARTVRNIVNGAFENKAYNTELSQMSMDMITVLNASDFGVDTNENPKEKAKEYLEKLDDLIGLKSVKEDIASLIDTINYQKEEEKRTGRSFKMPSLHMVFQGNPGTGKTTVARLYGSILREIGVLAKGQFIEASRSELVGRHQGETALLVKEKCKDAYGGILFIDEAYSLCTDEFDSFGHEAISSLIKEMEDNRERLVVILAGYTKEMLDFMDKNSGFKSRISKYMNFEDYTEGELYKIFDLYSKQDNILIDENVRHIVKEDMKCMIEDKDQNFGNARDVRKYFEKAKLAMMSRVQRNQIQGDDRRKIMVEDLM